MPRSPAQRDVVGAMTEEEVDKHILKKYEIQQKLGKGVSAGSVLRAAMPMCLV